MPQQDEDPGAGTPGPSEGISSSRNVAEVSLSPNQKQELPRVAEARRRDALARAQLRFAIPRTMARLENNQEAKRADDKLRDEVFGPLPKDGGTE